MDDSCKSEQLNMNDPAHAATGSDHLGGNEDNDNHVQVAALDTMIAIKPTTLVPQVGFL